MDSGWEGFEFPVAIVEEIFEQLRIEKKFLQEKRIALNRCMAVRDYNYSSSRIRTERFKRGTMLC